MPLILRALFEAEVKYFFNKRGKRDELRICSAFSVDIESKAGRKNEAIGIARGVAEFEKIRSTAPSFL